jgi:hypothetical protein
MCRYGSEIVCDGRLRVAGLAAPPIAPHTKLAILVSKFTGPLAVGKKEGLG